MYVVFRNDWRLDRYIDFHDVVSIEYKNGYYIMECKDRTKRMVDGIQYRLVEMRCESNGRMENH